jgi:mannose-6-phosphate isomerase-like protein (cupin superfamily)
MDITINFTHRPWGNYIKLFQEAGVWVKRVEVNPGCRLSLQRHAYRSEKWNIVTGCGLVVLGKREIKAVQGSMIDVPVGVVHRIGNTGDDPLVFIEVAVTANGGELSENDIVRLKDDYARLTARRTGTANGKISKSAQMRRQDL